MQVVRRRIKVTKDQFIDNGSYQQVYRISPQRVVKTAIGYYNAHQAELMVEDEIKGAKEYKFALPVLAVVDVVLPNGEVRLGTLRKYIPHKICRENKNTVSWRNFSSENKLNNVWDSYDNNYMIDNKGNFWRVDTQTKAVWSFCD